MTARGWYGDGLWPRLFEFGDLDRFLSCCAGLGLCLHWPLGALRDGRWPPSLWEHKDELPFPGELPELGMLSPFGFTYHTALQESGKFGRKQHTVLVGIGVAFEGLQELGSEQPMTAFFVERCTSDMERAVVKRLRGFAS